LSIAGSFAAPDRKLLKPENFYRNATAYTPLKVTGQRRRLFSNEEAAQ
jgi:hypothetical protein